MGITYSVLQFKTTQTITNTGPPLLEVTFTRGGQCQLSGISLEICSVFPPLTYPIVWRNKLSLVCLHQYKMLGEEHTTKLGELSMQEDKV